MEQPATDLGPKVPSQKHPVPKAPRKIAKKKTVTFNELPEPSSPPCLPPTKKRKTTSDEDKPAKVPRKRTSGVKRKNEECAPSVLDAKTGTILAINGDSLVFAERVAFKRGQRVIFRLDEKFKDLVFNDKFETTQYVDSEGPMTVLCLQILYNFTSDVGVKIANK